MPERRKPIRLRNVWDQWRPLWGQVCIYFWVKRSNIRYFFERRALDVLALSMFVLVLDFHLEAWGAAWARDASVAVRTPLFLAMSLALFTKIREYTDRRKSFYFVEATGQILRLLGDHRDPGELDKILSTLLALFCRNFSVRDGVCATVSAGDGTTTALSVRHVHPEDARLDRALRLGAGQGGAGYCCEDLSLVYIPWRRYRHAILQDILGSGSFHMVPDLYVPDAVEDFESILCVPLVTYGRCYGVLNFHSKTPNGFRRLDFAQATFYGLVLAQVLHRHESWSHGVRLANA